jgi:hypothetical protein
VFIRVISLSFIFAHQRLIFAAAVRLLVFAALSVKRKKNIVYLKKQVSQVFYIEKSF